MSDGVLIPLWLALLAGALALWAVLDRLLLPSARWYIRSRAARVLADVGQRLKIHVRPFQQIGRQALIDRLIFDDKVQQASHAFADERGMPREAALDQVRRYAREIVPAFNAYVYFRVGYWLGKRVSQALYRVRIGYTDDAGLEAIPRDATVVFVMNHRSNMDYIVASYLAAERAALSYAVGEWAQVLGLQQLIRAMGAYFVRRNSKDELYRRVLERYIAMATEAGVTQAVYPEGGLTKDGALREPRFGVIDYMLRGYHHGGERDLVFVPLGLNYDRVLEDRTQLRSGDATAPGVGRLQAAWQTLGFIGTQLGLLLRSRWHRFGYACVNFGTPVSVREWTARRGIVLAQLPKDQRQAEVAALGRHLMTQVAQLIPVLPVPLVTMLMVADLQRARSEFEIKAEVGALVRQLQSRGARLYVPRQDWDYAVSAGLRMLVQRHLVDEADGLFTPRASEAALLRYYARSIAHLLESPATTSGQAMAGA
ncbi:MAG: 1-acyl-sn-glycerol-3-phosphate acyltransferase [Rubrivivax sp.]|nr:1-acyl-sn-glycerol-3-phosphate acyltransferase [Rubrivivax sp.]